MDGILPASNAGLDAHRFVEAFKFAYGERTHLGDHRFVNVSEVYFIQKNTLYLNIIIHVCVHFSFQIYRKVNSDSHIASVQNKITDNFTSENPKYYGADFDMPVDHGTANMVVVDSMGNTVVGTSTINT